MSHKAVREFIRDTAKMVRDDVNFYYARESTFNVLPGRDFPAFLLKPLRYDIDRVNYSNHRVYKCNLVVYVFDSMEGDEVETQEALDITDEYITPFQAKLNQRILDPEDGEELLNADTIQIQNESVVSRIKQTTENMTGWEYTFDLVVPDQFSYCSIYD